MFLKIKKKRPWTIRGTLPRNQTIVHDGFEFDWVRWTELKIVTICSEKIY